VNAYADTAPALARVMALGGEPLAAGLAAVEQRLRDAVQGHGEVLAGFAGDTLAAGGKRLRPMLVLLCGGTGAGLAQAAAAVELLHMATLVHDDVLDRAPLRRGLPTVYAAGGRAAATATGDLLFSRAFAELVRTGDAQAVRALSSASSALARGELMQREDAWSRDVSEQRYLERCELKTGRLFEAACRLGALLGEPGPAAADGLARFGSRIGIAFQLYDDVLDVQGPPERTGKARGTDLLDGTVTLPLILAGRSDATLAGARPQNAEEAERICDRIAATGALEQAREAALAHVTEAKKALAALELREPRRAALDLVADSVVERYA
jgi:geranylgeranyl pyrophosphate synthase